jgi:hypothetical protein
MRRSLALALLSLAFALGAAAQPADGCICQPLPMPFRLTNAAEAFTGRIVSLRTAGGIDFLRVRVDQVLKGTQQSAGIVSIAVNRDHSHPVAKRVGQRWVFFAFPNASPPTPRGPRPRLVTSDCAGNLQLAPGQPAPDLATWNGPNLPDASIWMVPRLIAATRP